MNKHTDVRPLRVRKYARIRSADGLGTVLKHVGFLTADVEVTIDLAKIFEVMGAKAIRSKGRRAVDGYVTVRARSVREEGGAS